MGKQWKQWEIYLGWLQNHCRWWLQPWNWKMLAPWKKSYDQPRQHIKQQRHHFANKDVCSHVWMGELDHKEGFVWKNWCFWTVVLEKTLESPLDYKEIKLVNPKGNQSWIFIRRTDAVVPTLWPPDVKSRPIRKDPDAGKDGGRRRRGPQRMRWHHWLNGHEFE